MLVARLTPAGRGAIASVAVWGPGTIAATARWFHAASGRSLERVPLGRVVFGRWSSLDGEEIVACRRTTDRIDLHCHGGHAAVEAIIQALVGEGCRLADGREWILSQEADPVRAAARVALAHARTERTAAILLDQQAGALSQELDRIAQALADVQGADAADRLERLLACKCLGLRLTTPWRVVLAGRPNAGKSSLMNALLGFTRAIVHEQPGTTRDVVTATTAFEGWSVELADTAGLREGGDEVESAGIELAHRRLAAADLVLLVSDLTQPWSVEDESLRAMPATTVLVHNKCDLTAARTDDRPAGLPTSAVTGQGIEALIHSIAARLVPRPPPPGAAVPFLPEQVAALEQALEAILAGDAAAAHASIASIQGSVIPA